jgi:hypothetical protein
MRINRSAPLTLIGTNSRNKFGFAIGARMAGKIFINYRRDDDPGYTQALYLRLEDEFATSDLFMDVEGQIKPGDDFVAVLNAQVAEADVVLVVIGPRWSELLATRAFVINPAPTQGVSLLATRKPLSKPRLSARARRGWPRVDSSDRRSRNRREGHGDYKLRGFLRCHLPDFRRCCRSSNPESNPTRSRALGRAPTLRRPRMHPIRQM